MFELTLNGRREIVADADPNTTVLQWLRDRGMTGTKEGCGEGECGACAVVLVRRGPDGNTRYEPVNSCLLLLASTAGQELLSVEGVADGALHPVQEAMVRTGGSQCGYCTPGFVMSLFAEYYREGRAEGGFDTESIAGNLCRCTGYRPIRDAGRALPMVAKDDRHRARLDAPPPAASRVDHQVGARRYLRPTALADALAHLAAHPEATIVCGGTDLVVELNQRMRRVESLLSLEAVEELLTWEDGADALVIGAGVPLSTIEERLGVTLPLLSTLFPLFSSRLIRNRATLGGNLATASPIGDSPPALLALGAQIEVASAARGARTIPIAELFTGYRKTALAPDELMVRVRVPKPYPSIQRFYKVSKRVHDDISTVAAGFALSMDANDIVATARLAYGGVAATPVRASAAENALVGKPWGAASMREARAALEGAFTPMTDQRGSAAYRSHMVGQLFDKLCADVGVAR